MEARALRHSLGRNTVLRTGFGLRRTARQAMTLPSRDFDALAVAGLGGAVTEPITSGDVVVATEVRGQGRTVLCPSAPLLAGQFRRAGFAVHLGPLATSDHVVRGTEHDELALSGVLAVDMESSALAATTGSCPLAVVRVVVDTPAMPLARLGTPGRALHALRQLRAVGPVLEQWAAAVAPRQALLTAPRSLGAGVERGAEIATTNWKVGLRTVAAQADLLLMAGPVDSSNSRRLVETEHRCGARAYLVDDVAEVELGWLAGAKTVAVTAGASAPPVLVDELLEALGGLGPLEIMEHRVVTESFQFA